MLYSIQVSDWTQDVWQQMTHVKVMSHHLKCCTTRVWRSRVFFCWIEISVHRPCHHPTNHSGIITVCGLAATVGTRSIAGVSICPVDQLRHRVQCFLVTVLKQLHWRQIDQNRKKNLNRCTFCELPSHFLGVQINCSWIGDVCDHTSHYWNMPIYLYEMSSELLGRTSFCSGY
jgi:hypothetical protein